MTYSSDNPDHSENDSRSQESESFLQMDIFTNQPGGSFEALDEPTRTAAGWYSESERGETYNILNLLRCSEEPLCKLGMAQHLYPECFNSSDEFTVDPYGKAHNISKMFQKYYVDKVGRLIRSITDRINRKLEEIGDNQAQHFEFLRTVSLPIQVGFDENGRALYVFHGPDQPQSASVLESYIEFAESHQERNGRLANLAMSLRNCMINTHGSSINNDDVPEPDGLWENDESAQSS